MGCGAGPFYLASARHPMRLGCLFAAFAFALTGCTTETYHLHRFDTKQLSDVFYAEGANVGDFDKDGTLDLVSGPYWYAGPDFVERHTFFEDEPSDPLRYSTNFFPHVYDFNGDSWDDILIIGFPGKEARWYVNPQGGDGLWTEHAVYPIVSNESPMFTDLTGDDIPEIVCVSEGNFGYISINTADPTQSWTFTPISDQGEWPIYAHGLGVGDVNNDGRLDVLEKSGWFEQPASLENNPTWTHHAADFGKGGAQMYVYDVDGDGDNDVITSLEAHGYGLSWFENQALGDEIAFTEHPILGATPEENRYSVVFSQLHAVDLVDMNNNGLKDIITGKRFWAHGPTGDPEPNAPAVLYWFELARTADGIDFIPHLIHDNSGVGVQVVARDINADGLADVVVGNKKGAFVHLAYREAVDQATWASDQPKPTE